MANDVTETEESGRTSLLRAHLFRVAPLLVAIFALWAALKARELKIDSISHPGPGMWPLIVATVMGITALLLVWLDIREDYESWDRRSVRVIWAVVTLGVFVALFPILGFVISAFLILFVWMKFLAKESWRLALLLSVVGALVLNYIFVDLLAVPFPPGLLTITAGGG